MLDMELKTMTFFSVVFSAIAVRSLQPFSKWQHQLMSYEMRRTTNNELTIKHIDNILDGKRQTYREQETKRNKPEIELSLFSGRLTASTCIGC